MPYNPYGIALLESGETFCSRPPSAAVCLTMRDLLPFFTI
jgi:hypothetical protein